VYGGRLTRRALAVISFLVALLIASVGPSSVMYAEWFWPLFALVMKAPFIKEANRSES
jgi:hypothetical protein